MKCPICDSHLLGESFSTNERITGYQYIIFTCHHCKTSVELNEQVYLDKFLDLIYMKEEYKSLKDNVSELEKTSNPLYNQIGEHIFKAMELINESSKHS